MAGEGDRHRQHIVMLPFMAQGHLVPFLSLAKLLHRRHPGRFTITLLTTPLNLRNLLHHSADSVDHVQHHLLLRELPFSSADHGLPPGSENTDSLPHHHIVRLFHASKSLRPHFERFLSHDLPRPPLCVVADVFFGWTVDVARSLGAFHATFTTCGAYGTAAYFSLWRHLPHRGTDAEEFHVPGFPESFRLRRSQVSHYMRAADGEDNWSTFFRRHISCASQSDAMLCNTAEELETTGVRLLREITGLRVWTVGPLLPMDGDGEPPRRRHGKRPGISPEASAEWLGHHPSASVLYISFGSQNSISPSQMQALATGLASSGVPFIWVVRPPVGFDLGDSSDIGRWLPEGFEEEVMRRKKQGLLVRDWAPQLEILSHGSTGGFLSHCGWNSVLESLSRGVPVIGWPLASEQYYNAKMMAEELGVCVELARGIEEDVGSGEVERVIRVVMGAGEMRRKAAEVSEMMRAAVAEEGEGRGAAGSSLKAIDDFIQTVQSASASASASTGH